MPGRAKAEDGATPAHYPLEEPPSGGYRPRTIRNVLGADGTLILYRDALTGGRQCVHRRSCTHTAHAVLRGEPVRGRRSQRRKNLAAPP